MYQGALSALGSHIAAHERRYRLLLLAATPVLFAVVAIFLGKEAGWDLQNYHWYNPYAWLQGRLGFDVAVAHHATYYNPLADLPFYWIATHEPAWLAGAYLGALFGVAVTLIGAIAYQVINCKDAAWRLTIALLLALAGASGGGAFPALGNTSNDVPVAIGSLTALWLLLRRFSLLRSAHSSMQLSIALLFSGVCAGMSVGLKLTTATYALGILAATAITPPTWRKRSSCVLLLSSGMLLGIVVCGGFWFCRMWEYGRNPLFPYFNQWFHSPLLLDSSYRDTTYVDGHDWLGKLWFPWLFTVDSRQAAEWRFRDARILTAYLLIPISLLLTVMGKRPREPAAVQPGTTSFLFCFAAVAYLAWLNLFSIYRYLIPLEMLAPLLIAIAILRWPCTLKLRIAVIAAVLLIGQAFVSMNIRRGQWDNSYVTVQPPDLQDPQHSMILMSGTAPMAFVIPDFPSAIPFLRIDGWMVKKDDNGSLALQMRRRVAQHAGPLLLLFSNSERVNAEATARAYALRLLPETCQAVKSNIAEPLQLCLLEPTVSYVP